MHNLAVAPPGIERGQRSVDDDVPVAIVQRIHQEGIDSARFHFAGETVAAGRRDNLLQEQCLCAPPGRPQFALGASPWLPERQVSGWSGEVMSIFGADNHQKRVVRSERFFFIEFPIFFSIGYFGLVVGGVVLDQFVQVCFPLSRPHDEWPSAAHAAPLTSCLLCSSVMPHDYFYVSALYFAMLLLFDVFGLPCHRLPWTFHWSSHITAVCDGVAKEA